MDDIPVNLNLEMRILFPNSEGHISDNFADSMSKVARLATSGEYYQCLHICQQLLHLRFGSVDDIRSLGGSISHFISESVGTDNQFEREIEALCCAVSCLQLFVVYNWTGPIKGDLTGIFPSNDSEKVNEEILHQLEVDGESVYALVEMPILLYISKLIFDCLDSFSFCKTAHWWCLRYIATHQQLLSERSPTLNEKAKLVIGRLVTYEFLAHESHRSYTIQLHLEAGLLQLYYYQYKEAEKHFETANELAGIQCTLDGALGVRTRFQEKPLPQLRVKVTRSKAMLESTCPVISEADTPHALPLDDDTVLEAVKFVGEEDNDAKTKLTAEEQALVLVRCTKMQKTSPEHILRDEEIICFVEHLVSDPKNWSVHMEALRVRCNLQRHKRRTVERSMMQLESLVKNITPKPGQVTSDTHDTITKRLALFYSVWPKPSWILQKQLAGLFESLGVLSSALEIYKRLHMWEEAIVCLIRTGRGSEAETIIREQLAVKETPNLFCLLGDVLQDPKEYENAWQISNHKSSRAMRCLGAYKVSKNQRKEAIECFEKSLKINYLQVGVWFSMGCAALTCEDYEKAAKSFQKCVSLNWDNYEAWTNLSTSFVRCGKKLEAFRALREGLKCNFNRWELWENYLFVSTDTGNFSELIRAYNRLLDIKGKYVDTQVLEVLVRAMTEELLDANDMQAVRLMPKVLELFGRLTSKVTSDWEVWYLYAQLVENSDSSNKSLTYLQKALRSGAQRPSWEKDLKSAKKMTTISVKLVEACLHCNQNNNEEAQKKALLTTTRLAVNGVKTKLKMQEKLLLDQEVIEKFSELARGLEEKLVPLENTLQQL